MHKKRIFLYIGIAIVAIITLTALDCLTGTTGPVLLTITITPDNITVEIDGEQQFTATGKYDDGSSRDLTLKVDWSSDEPWRRAAKVKSCTAPFNIKRVARSPSL